MSRRLRARGLGPGDIPWWALALLDFRPGSDEHRVRMLAHDGLSRHIERSAAVTDLFAEVVTNARALAHETCIEEVVRDTPEQARRAAISDVRAFYQFTDVRDDTDRPVSLMDFQVRGVRAMRCQEYALELWPFGHGKSWHSSVTVPLMDWAEEPNFTQGRIYYNPKFSKFWMRALMWIVENNGSLHNLFPWIDRPGPDDPCSGIWSLDGFSIAGKSNRIGYSFEAFSYNAGIVGRRYMRTGCDDWVTDKDADSEVIQDAMWSYFFKGPMTFNKPVPFFSPFRTRASTVFVVGTLFDRRDFNHRLKQRWQEEGRTVHKVDVYVDEDETEVIWPEERGPEWVAKMRNSMTEEAFNARVRNRVVAKGGHSWSEEMVAHSLRDDFAWARPVAAGDIWIGFDPASGKRTRRAKFPAYCVLQIDGFDVHLLEWGRWPVPMPTQVKRLCDLARTYSAPIAVEDTSQQIAYADYVRLEDPHVRVVTHQTTPYTKRDWRTGVESLIPLWQNGVVFVHTKDAPAADVQALKRELLDWPQGATTDLVMALWIAKRTRDLDVQQAVSFAPLPVPGYASLHGNDTVLDLRALREAQGRIA